MGQKHTGNHKGSKSKSTIMITYNHNRGAVLKWISAIRDDIAGQFVLSSVVFCMLAALSASAAALHPVNLWR